LKKGDWTGLANLEDMDWGKDGIITFAEFLDKTQTE
jgi:hypothetical protein